MGSQGHHRLDGRPGASCCSEGSATRSGSASRPSPEATGPRRCRSRSRCSSRWACAASRLRSAPAPAAAGPPRTFFQEMARDIGDYLRDQMPVWRETHPGVEELRVAVMGCVVNGPGEIEARRHRHQPAGHLRGAGGAGLRGRAAAHDPARRRHRAALPGDPRGLRGAALSAAGKRRLRLLGPTSSRARSRPERDIHSLCAVAGRLYLLQSGSTYRRPDRCLARHPLAAQERRSRWGSPSRSSS